MMFEKNKEIYSVLLQHMESCGYSQDHIARIKTEINWLIRNQQGEGIQSYGEACRIREKRTESVRMRKCYRTVYAIFLFAAQPILQRDNRYLWRIRQKAGAEGKPIHNVSFSCSSFFLSMQKHGKNTLEDISEEDVMSFFFRGNGNEPLSGGYKDTISSVLKADLGIHTDSARRVLAYFPTIRQRRKIYST